MATASPELMQCMEVWGGNQICDRTLETPGMELWIYNRPFGDADSGGDVYYASSCASGRITRLLVADVSGHGEEVASIASRLRKLMRKHINVISQERFVGAMNSEFSDQSEGGFATAVAVTFFAPTQRLSVSNAGHPVPYLKRNGGTDWVSLADEQSEPTRPALPLGIIDSTTYGQSEIRFKSGDWLLLHTDSLCEAHDSNGEILGRKGLLELINSLPKQLNQSEVIPKLLEALKDANPQNLVDDDVTVVLACANGKRTPIMNSVMAPFRLVAELFRSSK